MFMVRILFGFILLFFAFGLVEGATEVDYPGLLYDIYVDATTSNTWATDSAAYPSLSDWSYGSSESASVIVDRWYRKEGSSAALYGTAFQGVGPALPQLTMVADGLDSAKTYNVYAVYWGRLAPEYWYCYVGLDGEPMWLADSTTEYDNIFCTGTFVIDGSQFFVGQVSGVSSVAVNIDGPETSSDTYRAWFDGLAFVETTPGPFVTVDIAANITDPTSFAVNPRDDSVIGVQPGLGANQVVQGKRIEITTDVQAGNCPDIYDFIGFSGDITDSENTLRVKADANISLMVNYEVLVYTPVCGSDICHPRADGDTNDDCVVDEADLVNLANNWLICTRPECD